MHELSIRKPQPPIPREPADSVEGGIPRPQARSADRGHLRSHPEGGPQLVPAHPGTAGRTDTARSPGKRRLYIISRRAARAAGPPPRGARAGPCGGVALSEAAGRPGPVQARSAARSRGGGRSPGMPGSLPRRAGRAMRGEAGGGSARAGVPRLPAGCRRPAPPAAPPGPAPAAHLSGALPEWLCGTAS